MKFGKTFRDQILKEWRFYAVNYKMLKKAIKSESHDEFYTILDDCKQKLTNFYKDKEAWATEYMKILEERVENLRKTSSESDHPLPTPELLGWSSSASLSSFSSSEGRNGNSPEGVIDLSSLNIRILQGRRKTENRCWLKDEYRRIGKSKHFQDFIYAKKSLATFKRDLDLLMEFSDSNATAFSKILKKFDKKNESSVKEEYLAELNSTYTFLQGTVLRELQERVNDWINEVNSLKPRLPEGWEDRKVYTIGCFDLFHRGHQNVLTSLREFGYFIVAGIHDDESYFKLKNKLPIDNLETRMKNVKPFVDQLFVIPSTDPLLYIKSVVSDIDIDMGSCCYARGDDMLNFPGREWIESVMPVYFVPRTESCSSSLIRTIYHAEDESLRAKAAFAKTRYDGKPVDENGNVLIGIESV